MIPNLRPIGSIASFFVVVCLTFEKLGKNPVYRVLKSLTN